MSDTLNFCSVSVRIYVVWPRQQHQQQRRFSRSLRYQASPLGVVHLAEARTCQGLCEMPVFSKDCPCALTHSASSSASSHPHRFPQPAMLHLEVLLRAILAHILRFPPFTSRRCLSVCLGSIRIRKVLAKDKGREYHLDVRTCPVKRGGKMCVALQRLEAFVEFREWLQPTACIPQQRTATAT